MDDVTFPEEYAVSGWYKWAGAIPSSGVYQPFKLAINEPKSKTARMGDNTLVVYYYPQYS